MQNIYCSECDIDFEGQEWERGECPNCGRKYSWEEFGLGEYYGVVFDDEIY